MLGIIVLAVGGYFLFTQNAPMFLQSSTSDRQLEQLVASSQLFVERSRALSEITLDTGIFDSEVFNSLKSFSPPPNEYPVGRNNPFVPAGASAPASSS